MISGEQEKTFAKGDLIFTEASRPDGVYIVRDGLVEIFQTVKTEEGRLELNLGRVGPRGIFGEMAAIDHQPRSASARALGPTTVLFIPKDAFQEHFDTLPPWVALLLKNMVRRLRETNRLLTEALKKGGHVSSSHLFPDDVILSSGEDDHGTQPPPP
jgi:CRP-like cAMP-binding protein